MMTFLENHGLTNFYFHRGVFYNTQNTYVLEFFEIAYPL